MALAESLASRCTWLHDGNIKMIGQAKDVVRQYLDHADDSVIGTTKGLADYKLRRGPGHVRVSEFCFRNSAGAETNQFNRGEVIHADITLHSFKPCSDVGIFICFKIGISGCALQTKKICVSNNQLDAGRTLKFTMSIDTEAMPATVYDLYVWVGPFSSKVGDDYYDILDSLLPPLEIRESDTRLNANTLIDARLVSGQQL
jgi:hypothetical protein